jgi:hypothetical protein
MACHFHISAVVHFAHGGIDPGGSVRRLMSLTLASSAVVAIACGKSKAPDTASMSADLKRDLQLAASTQNLRINPDEIAPKSQQELAVKPKAAASGPKIVRAKRPTVKATVAKVEEAPEIKTEIPQVQVMASAPAPAESPAPDSPPLARPAPMPAQTSSGNVPGPNTGSSGVGGILGGIFGAVIRGGVVVDDDHCDPRTPPRRGTVMGGGVYGRPGTMGGMGGMGTPGGMRPRF